MSSRSTMFWPSSESMGDLTPNSRIWSWYFWEFKVPVTTFNCIMWSSDKAPRTIMLQSKLLALKNQCRPLDIGISMKSSISQLYCTVLQVYMHIFPLVGRTPRRRVSPYKREYLYIHEYFYNKILVSWPIKQPHFNVLSIISSILDMVLWKLLYSINQRKGGIVMIQELLQYNNMYTINYLLWSHCWLFFLQFLEPIWAALPFSPFKLIWFLCTRNLPKQQLSPANEKSAAYRICAKWLFNA